MKCKQNFAVEFGITPNWMCILYILSDARNKYCGVLIGCEDAMREREKERKGAIEKMGMYIFAQTARWEWSSTVVTIVNLWIRKSKYDTGKFSSTLFHLSLVVVVDVVEYTEWHSVYCEQHHFYMAEKITKVNWSLQKFHSIICMYTHTSMASAFFLKQHRFKKKKYICK